MLPYVLAWIPMLVLAVLNGAVRELAYKKHVGELAAHQISTVTLLLLFAVYIRYIIAQFPPGSSTQAIFIGVLWVTLTLLFEFGFGRYRGNSWATLLADYNLAKGRLWIFIPVWILVAPYIFYLFLREN
ncbi:MAG TPA: hypothetical protein VFL47_04990 [Flavisolibacter sp.]|nr:hypothetical protein [Flavisolibacter sp.]